MDIMILRNLLDATQHKELEVNIKKQKKNKEWTISLELPSSMFIHFLPIVYLYM